MLLGNPGILGQQYGCLLLYAIPGCTWDSPVLLRNPGILGQGYGCVLLYAVTGCAWDSHGLLGNPDTWTGVWLCTAVCHPGMYLG